jgi:hypothetical protein
MFPKKENEQLEKQSALSPLSSSPRPSFSPGFGAGTRSSTNNALLSPAASKPKAEQFSLMPPPFVSPGLRATEAYPANWNKNPRPSVSGVGALPFTPSPAQAGKEKVNAKSWKGRVSFQAASPMTAKKNSVSPSFSSPHYGGSYLKNSSTAARPRKSEVIIPMEQTPDIQIQVTIPDIDKKIRIREARSRPSFKEQEEKVPEHIRKYRERETNSKRAEELKIDKAATKLQTYVLGWRARAAYPRLLEDHRERMQKNREKEERQKLLARQKLERQKLLANSAIKIQKKFRGYVRRKRYVYVLQCKRRREKNQKKINQIEKRIQKMAKQTKLDIKELKREHVEKKKDLKRNIRKQVKEQEDRLGDRLDDINRSGMNMVNCLQEENRKLKDEKQARLKKDTKVLGKQYDLLSQKSDEITNNFQSLQNFVQRKNAEIQKHEIASQKCRHRYLPQFRKELSDRNRHCIAEVRVKVLYKARLQKIVSEIEYSCRDPEIVQDAKEALQSCEAALAAMPDILVPEGLWEVLLGLTPTMQS